MRTSRTGWILGAIALGLVASCDSSNHLILLTLHASEPVSEIQVFTTSLDRMRPRYAHPSFVVPIEERDFVATPGRISVHVGGPAAVMVHVRARASDGDVLVATRCYDLVAQGVIEDALVLVGPLGSLDADADGFPASPADACQEPDANAGGAPRVCAEGDDHLCDDGTLADCDDANERIFPGASFPNTCQDGVDDDCDGDVDEACADLDGDAFTACPPTPTPDCDCDDTADSVNPRAPEVCEDAVDQDCDGMDSFCDRDGDGYPSDRDCDDDNPLVFPGASEAPVGEECDGVDNNCNGLTDEHPECLGPDLDGDGVPYCARGTADTSGCDCNDCDAGIHGATEDVAGRELCGPRVDPLVPGNGIDDDCDAVVDEGCVPEDMDGDGRVPPSDCDDTDPLAYPQTGGTWVEVCGDGVNQNCVGGGETGVCPGGDTDGDGFVEPASCEGNAMINPLVAETCNLVDDDCDGTTDEILVIASPTGCTRETDDVARLINYASNFQHCGGCRLTCDLQSANVCDGGACDCSTDASIGPCTTEALDGSPTCCPTGCEDTANDTQNCGGCGLTCGLGETCENGLCTCGTTMGEAMGGDACPDPTSTEASVCCSGSCRDVTSDASNCGGCGVACGSNSFCGGGTCQCTEPEVWGNCTDAPGCETDLRVTEDHCGGCGLPCIIAHGTGTCLASTCEIDTCDTNFDDCTSVAGCETDLLTTVAHCGACNSACALPQTAEHNCVGGGCQVRTCNTPFGDCTSALGCETNLDETEAHCGSCGNDCGVNATCVSGACVCGTGSLNCDGAAGCEASFTATTSCGACTSLCGARETCDGSGRCACGPDVGTTEGGGPRCANDCCPDNGGCTNTRTDFDNCGSCGNACNSPEANRCNGGACLCGGVAECADGWTCCGAVPGGTCRNLGTDVGACGACGMSCAAGVTNRCVGGNCMCGAGGPCGSGQTCCGDAPGGGCVDRMTDENNCGTCGNVCGTNQECNGGTCGCQPGFHLCGGVCVAIGDNSCGSACLDCTMTDRECNGTAASSTCVCPSGSGRFCTDSQTCEQAGNTSCGGSCVDCSATGRVCSSGTCVCAGGTTAVDSCGATCADCTMRGASTPACCGGATPMCVDLDDNPSSCGMCGAQCGMGEGCAGGKCTCGGTTATGMPGSGNDACTGSQTCVAGMCTG